MPIDFFYFEDFEWSIFGKLIGQKHRFENAFVGSDLALSFTKFFCLFRVIRCSIATQQWFGRILPYRRNFFMEKYLL
ncbi:hypothetical protein CJ232_04395 [Hoylesella timonensis]|uniref:Uncharacterized protein n=1 Tax=Hoylesella timonensis TaxID=386414 RepID=A0A2N6Q6X3_9BACT|nr:hypothetical protein CJ232_04395 [Hoylesella timonensis]